MQALGWHARMKGKNATHRQHVVPITCVACPRRPGPTVVHTGRAEQANGAAWFMLSTVRQGLRPRSTNEEASAGRLTHFITSCCCSYCPDTSFSFSATTFASAAETGGGGAVAVRNVSSMPLTCCRVLLRHGVGMSRRSGKQSIYR